MTNAYEVYKEAQRKNREATNGKVKGLSLVSKQAQILMNAKNKSTPDHRELTPNTIGPEAMNFVRRHLMSYTVPGNVKYSYGGIRGHNKTGSSNIDSGVATVFCEVQIPSGTRVAFSVPLQISHGEFQDPSIFVHNKAAYVISQAAIDDLVNNNSTWASMPTRGMYSPPNDGEQMGPPMLRRNMSVFASTEGRSVLADAVAGRTASLDDIEARKTKSTPLPKKKPDYKRHCKNCGQAPCMCPSGKKAQQDPNAMNPGNNVAPTAPVQTATTPPPKPAPQQKNVFEKGLSNLPDSALYLMMPNKSMPNANALTSGQVAPSSELLAKIPSMQFEQLKELVPTLQATYDKAAAAYAAGKEQNKLGDGKLYMDLRKANADLQYARQHLNEMLVNQQREQKGKKRDMANARRDKARLNPAVPSGKPARRKRSSGEEYDEFYVDNHEDYEEEDALDPAIRDNKFHEGQTVHLSSDMEIPMRGGTFHNVTKGDKAVIVRDVSGDGTNLLLKFPDHQDMVAMVQSQFVKKSA